MPDTGVKDRGAGMDQTGVMRVVTALSEQVNLLTGKLMARDSALDALMLSLAAKDPALPKRMASTLEQIAASSRRFVSGSLGEEYDASVAVILEKLGTMGG